MLVNAVLTGMPLFLMSFYQLPVWVRNKIDQIRRAFFWKGSNVVHGIHCLVNWKEL